MLTNPFKFFLYLFSFFILCSCSNTEVKNNSANNADSIPATVNSPHLLLDYKIYISRLDTLDVESSGKAARKYQELFKGHTPLLCDSGYTVFNGFYEKLYNNIYQINEVDTTNYEDLVISYYDSVHPPVSKKLLDYNQKLKDNGFQIAMDEGMTYIAQYRAFILSSFGSFVSGAMNEYLTEIDKETEEGFSSDGGIIISVSKLADRIVWWEKFVSTHPDFIDVSKAKDTRKYYLTYLFSGMDNTPLYDDAEKMTLSENYLEGYNYLLSKYPDSQAAALLSPFYSSVKLKQNSKAEALIAQYKKENLILRSVY